MRALFLASVFSLFTGCVNLNSPPTTPHSSSEMKKVCGCEGHETCTTMKNCGPCCTPDECKCKEITQK